MIPFSFISANIFDNGVVKLLFNNPTWVEQRDGTYNYDIPRRLHRSGVHPMTKVIDNASHDITSVNIIFSYRGDITLNALKPIPNFSVLLYGDNTDANYPAITTVSKVTLSNTNGAYIKNNELFIGGYNVKDMSSSDYYPSPEFEKSTITDCVDVWCGDNFIIIKRGDGFWYGKGDNTHGQLGLPEAKEYPQYTKLSIPTTASKVIASSNSIMYLDSNKIYVAGNPLLYGNGSSSQVMGFVESNISDVKDFHFVFEHAIVLKNDGTVWAVGYNSSYQFATPYGTNRYYNYVQCMVDGVNPLQNVTAIKTGMYNTIIEMNNKLYVAGYNVNNMCGASGDLIGEPSVWKVLADGYDLTIDNANLSYNCGYYRTTLGMYGAGKNDSYQLGLGNITPVQYLTALPDMLLCTPYNYSTLYVNPNTDSVYACGYNNNHQLGITTNGYVTVPTPVEVLSVQKQDFEIKSAAQIDKKTFILTTDNKILSCGSSVTGFPQSSIYIEKPHNIPGNIKEIYCGKYYSSYSTPFVLFALCENGDVWGIGDNTAHQLGIPDMTQTTSFIKLPISNIKKLDIGHKHSMALTNDNKVYMCGDNYFYQQGYQDYNTPRVQWEIIPGFEAIDIAAGASHSMILLSDGTIRNCGYAKEGELGHNGTRYEWTAPVIPSTAAKIYASHYESFYLDTTNNLYGCGWNNYGVLGISGVIYTFTKIDEDVQYVSVGSIQLNGTLFAKTSTSEYFRGCNITGIFGNGTPTSSSSNVVTTIPATKLWLGESTLFVDPTNKLWSCGSNNVNQLSYATGVSPIMKYYKPYY